MIGTFRFIAAGILATCTFARGAEDFVLRSEMKQRDAWLDAHLIDVKFPMASGETTKLLPLPDEPGLEVLANHDPVIQNSRGGHPLKIGDHEFKRGLYCHANSKIVVKLPGPGKKFTAVCGLDHNDDTARGKGSVIFSVTVGGKVAFKSDVMRFGTPAREVDVDLGGADSFAMEIGDSGDGIGWDQSDWADAKVTLADGRELWLGDMPLRDHNSPPGASPISRTSSLPFSFIFGSVSSDELFATWKMKSDRKRLDASRTQRTLTWTDKARGFEVRCAAVEYRDYPAVEWTLFFKNTGTNNSPVIENVAAIDSRFDRGPESEFVLHTLKGDWCSAQSYAPVDVALGPKQSKRFAPDGGRPTNGPNGWPFYNLQMPGGGLLMAIGWPGQWASSFTRDETNGLRILAGQQLTYLYLKPGEEIRTPMIALVFWSGDDVQRAQNLWRRWMLAHNVPRVDGKLPAAMLQMQVIRSFEKSDEKDLFALTGEFNDAKIPYDLCWRDAGWYRCSQWTQTGTWEIDTNRYPRGFRPFADWVHKQGKQFIVWFEPERVGAGDSWLAQNHRDWIIGGNLLNLGNDDARRWLTDHIDAFIKREGLDWYRQDFNMDPLNAWRGADEPNRRGMAEIKHVTGYLAFWDELLRRNPNLRIDSCASGGRRNDLETLRRSVPLLRSDFQFGAQTTMPNQGHTWGISSWIPYYGSGCTFSDPYSARSYLMPCTGFAGHDANTKRCYDEARRVTPLMLADFYPLTPYSIDKADWIAWEFFRPETGDGFVQAFRRDDNKSETLVVKLRGLEPRASYEIENLDGGTETHTGRELADGFTITLKSRPASALFLIRVRK